MMMKKFTFKRTALALSVLISAFNCQAQTAVKQEIDKINTPAVGLAPLRFLASDDLKGRATMRPEINIADRYISEAYRSLGLKELPGTSDYFQNFELNTFTPAKTGGLTVNSKLFAEIGRAS